jgi:hypothetical protein
VITSILNTLRDKNTQKKEDSDKDQEQNESSVDPVQDMISSIQDLMC